MTTDNKKIVPELSLTMTAFTKEKKSSPTAIFSAECPHFGYLTTVIQSTVLVTLQHAFSSFLFFQNMRYDSRATWTGHAFSSLLSIHSLQNIKFILHDL